MNTAPPTAAQLHLALDTVRSLPPESDAVASRLRAAAAVIIQRALTEAGWTGSSPDCASFGAVAEESAATIRSLQDSLMRAGELIEVFQAGLHEIHTYAELGSSAETIRDAVGRVMKAVEAAANGVPAAGSDLDPSAGAGSGSDPAKTPPSGSGEAVLAAQKVIKEG